MLLFIMLLSSLQQTMMVKMSRNSFFIILWPSITIAILNINFIVTIVDCSTTSTTVSASSFQRNNHQNQHSYHSSKVNQTKWTADNGSTSTISNHHDDNDHHHRPDEYFDEINARNHRPLTTLMRSESQTRVAISNPDNNPDSTSSTNVSPNVYYYNPKIYGQNNPNGIVSAQQITTEQSIQPNIYKLNSASISSNQVATSSFTGNGNSHDPAKIHSYYSNGMTNNDLNKSILQKYYNREISSMTNALNKHNPTSGSNNNNVNVNVGSKVTLDKNKEMENGEEAADFDDDHHVDNEDDDATVEDEEDIDHHRHHPPSVTAYVRSKQNDNDPQSRPKGFATAFYRIHPSSNDSPRLLRRYHSSGRSSATTIVPVRLQTSHSHTMPHYYIPHSSYETIGSHHHINLPEKSGTWLGSGLAAGILIGAIPFGIMMASMMPTLFTGAMPIVNTAAVGKKRRKRSVELFQQQQQQNLFDHHYYQPKLDKLGIFLRRSIQEMIGLLNEQNNNNNYMAKKSPSYQMVDHGIGSGSAESSPSSSSSSQSSSGQSTDLVRTVARYAMAAMDEPKCVKEMLCSLMADGRHSKTTPLQKTLYLLIKWLPKDLGRTFGLDGLFNAVRKNSCITTYKCPISLIHLKNDRQHKDIYQSK